MASGQDVQPKLAARARLLAAEAVNKNDPSDARPVAAATGAQPYPDRLPTARCAVRVRPRRHQQRDHRAADTAAAAGVAVSGAIIAGAGGWYWLDPATALVIAVIVGYHALKLICKITVALRSA
jgi:hypothetical protein